MNKFVDVIVIDESDLFREGLLRVLSETRYHVVAHYKNLRELPPDGGPLDDHSILLIGIDNDFEAALARLPSIKSNDAQTHVIMLGDQFDPEQLLSAIEAGADGYLLKKQVDADGLLKSMDLVVLGECVFPRRFIDCIRLRLHAQIALPAEPAGRAIALAQPASAISWRALDETDQDPRLSHKERLILGHLTHGASNKHIARELQIAEATVKVHVKGILRKMRVQNRTQAAMWAVQKFGDHPSPA